MAKRVTISSIFTLVLAAINYYFKLPALHIKSVQFWGFIFFIIICFLVIFFFSSLRKSFKFEKDGKFVIEDTAKEKIKAIPKRKKRIAITAVSVIIFAVLAVFISSSPIFNAQKYRNLLNVKASDFNEDIAELKLSQIPVVDRDTAERLGSRKIGEVVELVSQFNVSELYTQINYKGVPTRVSPLEYADIIKWLGNRNEGVPYYVTIDMATQKTDLVELETGMKYLPSEYFGRDLMRHVRFKYPTKMFQSTTFEIDDNGNPYWSVSYYDYTIGVLGGRDVVGIILVDAVTGEMRDYTVSEVPKWVDTVYDSTMLIEQANYWGHYVNGFINSIFGQKNVVSTTDGYNYIASNDDVWMYTGITSVVEDASNVGFLLVNLRTKEAKRYDINGAEEISAMRSAEGMIQEKGYSATFPILVNVANTPSYFISLKDNAGLVKAYSFVSVSNYQIVGVSDTMKGAMDEYLRLLKSMGVSTNDTQAKPQTNEISITVTSVASAVLDGNTVYYIKTESGEIYTATIALSDTLPFVKPGDKLNVLVDDALKVIKEIK